MTAERVTTRALTLVIPGTPDQALSPNRTKGKHWADKAIRRAERDLAWATKAAFLTCAQEDWPETPPLDLIIRAYWERGRHAMDHDNLIASIKRGLIDRIAFELGVDDKHFRFSWVYQDWDPDGRGYMIVEIREA